MEQPAWHMLLCCYVAEGLAREQDHHTRVLVWAVLCSVSRAMYTAPLPTVKVFGVSPMCLLKYDDVPGAVSSQPRH